VADPAGQCHTETWCKDDQSAVNDCAEVLHPAVPGFFSCNAEYSCDWQICGLEDDPSFHYTSNDLNTCSRIYYVCDADQNYFSNACGCGCKDM